jgi:D-glycero-alpha-D-manno-heptose-7-phosphate kinase
LILSRAPLRISFFGGGTDLPSYYTVSGGAVLSATIDRFVYVMLGKKFDGSVRIGYSRTENVQHVGQVRHQLIRECLKQLGISSGIEVVTMADVPGKGTGLGSSSALGVALLEGLFAANGVDPSPEQLASMTCDIEINSLNQKIGKQDQYAAAFGGLNYITFEKDGRVVVESVICSEPVISGLENRLISFFIPRTVGPSAATKNLDNGIRNDISVNDALADMREQAKKGIDDLRKGDLDRFGLRLNEAWELKKKTNKLVTNSKIDLCYKRGLDAGAIGGKLSGSGGGGFLTFLCDEENQPQLRRELKELVPMKFRFHRVGAEILHNGGL